MKLISRDATAFVDVNNLRKATVEWPARWLNKYADKMFEVVKRAILCADPKVTETVKSRLKATQKILSVAIELESLSVVTKLDFVASTATPASIIPPSSLLAVNTTSNAVPKTLT